MLKPHFLLWRFIARPRVYRSLFVLLFFGVLGFTFVVGWFDGYRDPRQITGFNRLPQSLQPQPYRPGSEDPQLVWLGHAGYEITWHGVRILLDPNLSENCKLVPRLWAPPELAGDNAVDAVLISHAHYDHFDLPTLAMLPGRPMLVLPKGDERYLTDTLESQFQVRPILAGQSRRVGSLTITAVPAAHQGGRSHPFPVETKALGYMIGDGLQTVYFAGDTAFSLDFEAVAARYRPDIAILPIGAFAPRFPLRFHHLNPEEAVQAAKRLGVKHVFPCHFGTFRLAFDRPGTALPRFAAAAREHGVSWHLPFPPWSAEASVPEVVAQKAAQRSPLVDSRLE